MAQGRTATQTMTFWSLCFAAISLIMAIVIRWLYPFSYEHDLSRHPIAFWITGYALSVLALSLLALLSSAFWYKRLGYRPGLAAFLSALATLTILLLYGIAVTQKLPLGFGLGIIDVINAKFMAEWKFLNFIGVIAPICSILTALLTWIQSRYGGHPHRSQPSSATLP